MMEKIYARAWANDGTWIKMRSTDRIRYTVWTCELKDCPLRKAGLCVLSDNHSTGCPYGKESVNYGVTRRSKNFKKNITEFNEQNKKYGKCYQSPEKLCYIGDFVYLMLDFIGGDKDIKPYFYQSDTVKKPTSFSFLNNEIYGFIKKSDFTETLISKIIEYRPYTIIGYDEITRYRLKSVPVFMRQLAELDPKLYSKVIKLSPKYEKLYGRATFNNIGREADLYTITPNKGVFKDASGNVWKWNGKFFLSMQSNDEDILYVEDQRNLYGKTETEVKFTPDSDYKNQRIKITDEEQVNENTKFFD